MASLKVFLVLMWRLQTCVVSSTELELSGMAHLRPASSLKVWAKNFQKKCRFSEPIPWGLAPPGIRVALLLPGGGCCQVGGNHMVSLGYVRVAHRNLLQVPLALHPLPPVLSGPAAKGLLGEWGTTCPQVTWDSIPLKIKSMMLFASKIRLKISKRQQWRVD